MNNMQKQILNVIVIVSIFIKNNINNVMYYDDSYIIRMNGCQVFKSEEEAFNKFHGYIPAIIDDDDDEEEEEEEEEEDNDDNEDNDDIVIEDDVVNEDDNCDNSHDK